MSVAIIPHTVEMTNLKTLKPGDPVNLEADIVAKYLEKWFKQGREQSGLTVAGMSDEGILRAKLSSSSFEFQKPRAPITREPL